VNEDLKFFSQYDIRYCFDVINNKQPDEFFSEDHALKEEREEAERLAAHSKTEEEKKAYKKERLKTKIKTLPKQLFEKLIYKWHPNFRFSSRVINAHLVAIVALYYAFVQWLVGGVILFDYLQNTTYDMLNMVAQMLSNMVVDVSFDFAFGETIIKSYHVWGYHSAAIAAFIICILQSLLGLRSIKYTLMRINKAKRHNAGAIKGSVAICNANSHFTGFLVGFLINGFVCIFSFFFALSVIIFIIHDYNFWNKVWDFLLKCVPIIVVMVVKTIFNFIMSKFVFLQQTGKILALNNFRCYSIFVYVMFFFDSIVGVISAVIRLIIGSLGSLFFLPRVGYSFLGKI
jgi:hypothetical protein